MAPIVCKVVDTSSSGVPGIRATLEYKNHDGMTLSKVESISDVHGRVRWLPLPFTKDPLLDPHICAWVSLTFVPNDQRFPVSWLSIQADVYLSPESHHAFTLHLNKGSADYRVEHANFPRPTLRKMDWATSPIRDGISGCLSPSPLQLPPLVFDGAVGHLSKKRKRSSEDNEPPPKRR
ncbi:hypothetical protein B0T10DRAFT_572141 [Thelonectria olida]|uniref:Uncharacterized protein n=1 Tax=Thelonectria olida TaxID=1576542 RepID=A0A9P9AMB3_9HYPO|nr:hypothetical protein B0T10DRAFT_572141 [Thelonectria olida]